MNACTLSHNEVGAGTLHTFSQGSSNWTNIVNCISHMLTFKKNLALTTYTDHYVSPVKFAKLPQPLVIVYCCIWVEG